MGRLFISFANFSCPSQKRSALTLHSPLFSGSFFSAILPTSIITGKDQGKVDRHVFKDTGSFLANLVNLANIPEFQLSVTLCQEGKVFPPKN